jgi:uncharacterized SAM-binding protein YcdF (DUF218 family)
VSSRFLLLSCWRCFFGFVRWLVLRAALVWSLWLGLGGILQFPATQPVHADAVIMLGGGDGFRFAKASQLVRGGYAKTLMLSHPVPSDLMGAGQLKGVRLFTNKDSDSSWSEAQAMRRWMEENHIQHVLVVSDPPHFLRLAYTWYSVFRGAELDYTFVASEPSWWSAWRWWDNEEAALFTGTEVLKLAYYLARYRFGFGD